MERAEVYLEVSNGLQFRNVDALPTEQGPPIAPLVLRRRQSRLPYFGAGGGGGGGGGTR